MQEIIVYRNPMEAAFWQMVMSGEAWPVMVAVVVFFAVFLGLHHVLSLKFGYARGRQVTWFSLGTALIVAQAVARVMWI